MQDNLSIVITMIILVTLIIIFPLYNFFERQDDMSYNLVLKATTNFVDEVRNNGYIDQSNYDNFVKQLANTGIIYDIELEAHRKILLEDENKKDEYVEKYEIDYNNDIFDEIDATLVNTGIIKQKIYTLNEDDQIYVKVNNKNKTTAELVFSMIAPNTNNKSKISVNYGGVIKNAAWKKVDGTHISITKIPFKPILTSNPDTITNKDIPLRQIEGTSIKFKASSVSTGWWKEVKEYNYTITYPNGRVENIKTDPVAEIERMFPEGTNKVSVYAVDSDGEVSETTETTFRVYSEPPSRPTLVSTPDVINNNIISPGSRVTFTAVSIPWKPFISIKEYVWIFNGREIKTPTGSLTVNVANGANTITVYAVDSLGKMSERNGAAFIAINNFASSAITGVGVVRIDSILIPDTTVTNYTFTVTVSRGHGGADWWRVSGLTKAGTWETITGPNGVSNGINTSGTVTPNKYIQLRFEYNVDRGHGGCINSGSNIRYTAGYKF